MSLTLSKRCLIGFGIYIAVCLLIALLPTYGPPHFRYTGSDPDRHVWNLGWPMATAIWDPNIGLHVGPFAYILYPLELFVGVTALGFIVFRTWWRDSH